MGRGKEIPWPFDIVRSPDRFGFFLAEEYGIPSLEIDNVFDRQIIPRGVPYSTERGAKIGLAALRRNGKL